MKCELLCQAGQRPTEPCWNKQALAAYARGITGREKSIRAKHPEISVSAGRIECDGVAENEYGHGSVCLAFIMPTLVIAEDKILSLPELVTLPRQIEGFKFFKPDGGLWDHRYNLVQPEETNI